VKSAEAVAEEVRAIAGTEAVTWSSIDIRDRKAIKVALEATVQQFGGIDILINTAALFSSSSDGMITDAQWALTLEVNVTANYLLADEIAKIFAEQGGDASVVLTSSANAVVAKRGTEAYDVSKAALSHLVRELAVSMAPKVRVNAISPATVVKGSTMFPRDRVIASLKKYDLPFDDKMTDDELRNVLAQF
jgi:NAD(P)-dependent dehydrogenase (short-subunit alcohol dehydrogenase family)